MNRGFRRSWGRNGLLVFQFTIAIGMIIATAAIYSQLHYIRNKGLGYNRDQVITISHTSNLGSHVQTFAQQVRQLPGIVSSTITGYLPNTRQFPRGFFTAPSAHATETVLMGDWRIDADYLSTLGMEIVAGRNFSPLMPTDSGSVLINETAARALGYTDPVGRLIYTGPTPLVAHRILGVVRDFNAESLRNPVAPIVFSLAPDQNAVSFRIATRNLPALIGQIRDLYQSMGAGDQPFVYSFLDDDFNRLYQSDERLGQLFFLFSTLAIFIACLGLFGLTAYAIQQRTREIGIRKVLGAGIRNILILLSADILRGITLATLIACPLAGWAARHWLQDFAYRTTLHWWLFASAVGCALLLTVATIALQAFRATLVNPVDSLRANTI